MALYCNESAKLRQGGRKAPAGGKDKLEELFKDDQKLYDFINGRDYKDPAGNITDLSTLAQKFQLDCEKFDVSSENTGDRGDNKLGTTKHGIDYISTWMCGDWELPVQVFIYWDGKHYRGYIPTKGNCINTINKSAFGNDESADDKYCMKEFGVSYAEARVDIEIDFAACLEDFEARLEVDNKTKTIGTEVTASQVSKETLKREYSRTLTTPDESLELISLGLPLESADLLYHNPYSERFQEIIYIDGDKDTKDMLLEVDEYNKESTFIPAWSSSRMIELLLKTTNAGAIKVDYIISGDKLNMIKDNVFAELRNALKVRNELLRPFSGAAQ